MKKVTIILGKQGCGKPTKAKELAKGKKCMWLTSFDTPFIFSTLKKSTEVICIDEIPPKNIEEFKMLITSPFITVNRRGKDPFTIKRPEIIATSNFYKKSDFRYRPYIEVIEL